MKKLIPLATILLAAVVCADPADPQISNVRLNQNSISRRVTVRYDLHPSFYGVEENDPETFNIVPNPATGLVTVIGENLRQTELFNMLGQQVLSLQCKGTELQIDMTALPAGIYFVTVTDEDGRKCVKKVVKE